MITCDTLNCVMPGRWKAVVASKGAVHWGEEVRLVDTGTCFCAVHKAQATLDSLFNPTARRALDGSFAKQCIPAIDWSRSELTWAEVDPRTGLELALKKEGV